MKGRLMSVLSALLSSHLAFSDACAAAAERVLKTDLAASPCAPYGSSLSVSALLYLAQALNREPVL